MSIDGIRAVDKEPLSAADYAFVMSVVNGQRVGPRPMSMESLSLQIVALQPNNGASRAFKTKAEIDASLSPGDHTLAWVVADPVAANNGVYRKIGGPGVGSWERIADLPYSFVRLFDVGAGSANAIQVTSTIPTSPSVLRIANVFETNTGNVTISENGGAARPLKTSSGNQIQPGGLVAGMMIAYVDDGTSLRLITDQVSSAIVAAAEAAAVAAQAAASSVQSPKATISQVQADTPASDPDYYIVAFYDTAQQPGSGSLLRKVGTGGSFQNGNGTRYEVSDPWLRPEQFGRIGVNTAGDTAAWTALAGVANARGGVVKVKAEGEVYLIQGNGVHFQNLDSLWLRLGEETEFRQKAALSQTFRFTNVKNLKVTGGHFFGYAQTQIDAGQTPNEVNFNSSSYNGVAALYMTSCAVVDIRHLVGTNHAGGCITAFGSTRVRIDQCRIAGLGPTYNRPVIDGHQGNGGDCAIYVLPVFDGALGYYNPATTTAWVQELEVMGCQIKWHSVCVRTILNNVLRIHGNTFDETPGQHHVYDSDSDGLSVIGNMFQNCRQIGFKMQFENLGGINYGPAWAPSTAYSVGSVVRAVSILFVCTVAHTSGGSFDSSKFVVHPRFNRKGAVIQGNNFKNCGEAAIATVASSNVFGRNIWAEGYLIKGNEAENCGNGIACARLWKSQVEGNSVRGGAIGYYLDNFAGSIRGNAANDVAKQGYLVSISQHTAFEENKAWNCGKLGTTDDQKAPVVFYAPDANSPPANAATPTVWFDRTGIIFDNVAGDGISDAVGPWLCLQADTRVRMEISRTYGTPSTKLFRVDGTILYQFANYFTGYVNTAQNESTWTLNNETSSFTLDPTTATAKQVADVLATVLNIYAGKRFNKTV